MRGVTSAKPAAGPVLLLRSFGIIVFLSQFQRNNNITALIEDTDVCIGQTGISPLELHHSFVSLSFESFGNIAVLTRNLC